MTGRGEGSLLRVGGGEPAPLAELGGFEQGLFPAAETASGPGTTPSRGDQGDWGKGATAVQNSAGLGLAISRAAGSVCQHEGRTPELAPRGEVPAGLLREPIFEKRFRRLRLRTSPLPLN